MDLINPLVLIPALLVTTTLYYMLPESWRRPYLLLLSLAFLASITLQATFFLLAINLLNYAAGLLLERKPKQIRLRTFFILLNGLVLVLPRYFNLIHFSGLPFPIHYLIPLGIAFITLQNIGYLLDVSHGVISAEHNLINFLLYTCFFAKLSAGPIEAARRFLPQLKQNHPYQTENIQHGLFLIGTGIFKKIVVADRLALINDLVFNHPGQYYGLTVITAAIFYSFQIYFDFSGYTDIARGLATTFGYELSINFDKPFLAENINDFWSRWHITLTAWLREYIFFPARRFFLRKRNATAEIMAFLIPPLLTMLASGLWHGLKLTFIVWGIYHGMLLYYHAKQSKKKARPPKGSLWSRRLLTFGLVTFGWFFFRPASLADTGVLLQSIFVKSTTYHDLLLTIDAFDLSIAFIAIVLVMGFEIFLHDAHKKWSDLPVLLRWTILFVILLAISMLGVYQPGNTEFIYAGF